MSIAALIVAAGRGTRAGGGLPKQYRPVGGLTVLARTLQRFATAGGVTRIALCIHPDDADLARRSIAEAAPAIPVALVEGGAERAESVRRGLEALAADQPDKVLIHDAARPFVSPAVIAAVIDALDEVPGACAAIPIVDALRREAEGGICGPLIPREGAWRAQTPQGFRFAAILGAHRANTDPRAPDDAEIARAAGLAVRLIESEADNFKITRPGDFARAERLLRAEAAMAETRMGTGFDVHRFGPGDHVMLCGVRVPHDRGFVAHSDGDVALHALTDAILGAVALGDIGRWFPPSDPQWKGASSDRFLVHALAEAAALGFRPVNLDVTILCERPKIGPHAAAMRARIAALAGVDPSRVSVKATTTEGLGFTGRGEGIAAQAAAVLTGVPR